MKYLLIGLLCCAPAIALGHGAAEWIQRGAYKEPGTNVHCCGQHDCEQLSDQDVQPVPGGFLIRSLGEFVPMAESQVSEDGKWWRCHKPDGSRRCFFWPGAAA